MYVLWSIIRSCPFDIQKLQKADNYGSLNKRPEPIFKNEYFKPNILTSDLTHRVIYMLTKWQSLYRSQFSGESLAWFCSCALRSPIGRKAICAYWLAGEAIFFRTNDMQDVQCFTRCSECARRGDKCANSADVIQTVNLWIIIPATQQLLYAHSRITD